MLILKDFKLSLEEEEREKLITMPERDWSSKIEINTMLINIDL